jgi:hypothetical protein
VTAAASASKQLSRLSFMLFHTSAMSFVLSLFRFFFFLLFFGFSLINMWQRAPLSARSRSFRTRVRA